MNTDVTKETPATKLYLLDKNIVDLALTFIRKRGFSSFSYDDIAKRLGITKAAIHYHFESKEDLGIAVCEKIEKAMLIIYEQNLAKIKNHTGTPWNYMESMLSTIGENENCPISSMQSDYENLTERFRKKIKDISNLQMNLFIKLAKAFSPDTDDRLLASYFLSVKGALQYKRIFGDDFFNNNINFIKSQFEVVVKK